MHSFLILIDSLVSFIVFILIIQVVMSWLIAFNLINSNNKFIWQINYALHKLTNPLLSPIQQILPIRWYRYISSNSDNSITARNLLFEFF